MAETMFTAEVPWSGRVNPEELEQRIHRLEDAVASLCDNTAMEKRVRDVVVKQLREELQRLKAAGTDLGFKQSGDANGGADGPDFAASSGIAATAGRTPFLWDVWSDVSLLFRMIRDPYFRMSWPAKIVPLFALAYVIVLSIISWAVGYQGFPVLSQLDDLLVIYIGFKVLGRELRRYRSHLNGS